MDRLAISVATTLQPSWNPFTYVKAKVNITRIQKETHIRKRNTIQSRKRLRKKYKENPIGFYKVNIIITQNA